MKHQLRKAEECRRTGNRIRAVLSQILFYVALALILLCAVWLCIGKSTGSVRFLFGRSMLWVETGSMYPTIEARSYILVRATEGKSPEVGDVVVFVCPDRTSPVYGKLVTHRVIGTDGDVYLTRGDGSGLEADPWRVGNSDIVAFYVRNLPVLTVLARILSSPFGIVLPMGIFLFVCAFLCFPSMKKSCREEAEAERERQHRDEIERRVREEVARWERERPAWLGSGSLTEKLPEETKPPRSETER